MKSPFAPESLPKLPRTQSWPAQPAPPPATSTSSPVSSSRSCSPPTTRLQTCRPQTSTTSASCSAASISTQPTSAAHLASSAESSAASTVHISRNRVSLSLSSANPAGPEHPMASRDPLNQLAPPGWRLEGVCKVLRLSRYHVTSELHDAHCVRRLTVIGQNEFSDPEIAAANDSLDRKSLFARLTRALILYVAPAAGALS